MEDHSRHQLRPLRLAEMTFRQKEEAPRQERLFHLCCFTTAATQNHAAQSRMISMPPMTSLQEQFAPIDIYLFDQLQTGPISPGLRVLDAACGSGRNLEC